MTISASYMKEGTDKFNFMSLPRYNFNVDTELKVGDIIATNKYNKNLIVSVVLDTEYKFFNPMEGLKNEANHPKDIKIAEISFTGKETIQGKVISNIYQ